jgi:hypothetical protein
MSITWLSRIRQALQAIRPTPREQRSEDARRAAYTAHLRSAYWQALRQRALTRATHQCEWIARTGNRCRVTRGLEVHHTHYATFGHETLLDVCVLCPTHHAIADRRRRKENERRKSRRGRG